MARGYTAATHVPMGASARNNAPANSWRALRGMRAGAFFRPRRGTRGPERLDRLLRPVSDFLCGRAPSAHSLSSSAEAGILPAISANGPRTEPSGPEPFEV